MVPIRTLATILSLLALLAVVPSASAADRTIRGVVTDESNGVLPGVTVVATGAEGQVLATTVTDSQGRYALGPLAAGRVTVTFQLAGFARVITRVDLGADADAVANQRLLVASQSETVDVVGRVPVPFPAPPPPPAPIPPRPRPLTRAVPEHDRDSVCGPAKLGLVPESAGIVRSRRYKANGIYSEGDELVIEGGTADGLGVGRNLVVRRTFTIQWDPRSAIGEHTAGLVQIVSADARSAIAVVIYACDEILPGDRLASFHPEPRRAPAPAGTPDYRHAARILFPDAGQLLGAPRRLMVIDQGSESGVRAGQRVTLFRHRLTGGKTPLVVGDGVVVAVRGDSATIRVEHVTDAIFFGDLAALQR